MFKNPFSFEGRIRRTEYGISLIIYYIYLVIILTVFGAVSSGGGSVALLLFFIPAIWFVIAQGSKRCHDIGNSAGYQFIPFYLLWMLFAAGNGGSNRYGLNPKTNIDLDEIDEIGSHLTNP